MRKTPHSIHSSLSVELFRPLRMTRRSRKAALRSGMLLAVFTALLFAAAPARLPLLFQRLVGLTSALLVMLFVTFALNEVGASYRKFGMSDEGFGRLLNWVGWGVFALVLAVWFTHLAPIQSY
jgi:hypothetical protein